MSKERHIFFDLDKTLWDFERSSRETLVEMVEEYQSFMGQKVDSEGFILAYQKHNQALWRAYRRNEIDSLTLRTARWERTLEELEVEPGDWVHEMGEAYLRICPTKPYLMPNARELLDELRQEFSLHIITNGFLETQKIKMHHAELEHYFGHLITPEATGSKKPDSRIFFQAMELSGAKPEESMLVGDDYEADVEGGHAVGLKVVFYNPYGEENPDGFPEIKDLLELKSLLV